MNGNCEFETLLGTCVEQTSPNTTDSRSELFCPAHCSFEWRVCKGCGGSAIRECLHEDPEASPQVCREPLCNLCWHEGQGHTQEAPSEPLSPPTGQAAIDALRADLEKSIRDSLIHAGEHQIPLDKTARLIFDNLSLHITFQMLSGMAAHPPQ